MYMNLMEEYSLRSRKLTFCLFLLCKKANVVEEVTPVCLEISDLFHKGICKHSASAFPELCSKYGINVSYEVIDVKV